MKLSSNWLLSTTISVACVTVVTLLWRLLNWVWLRPRKLEKCFREQGFGGNNYRLLYGDTKDKARMVADVRSKPMPHLSHDHLPRVLPLLHHTVKNYGKRSIMWNGPTPVVTIAEPELLREVFMKISEFQKPKSNPFLRKLTSGLVQVEGHEWAKRRKMINPSFHIDKLKVIFPVFLGSSHEMIRKWEEKMIPSGSCEVDVWSYMHKLSADVISRAAFGSSYEEGRRIFQLLTQQIIVVVPVLNSVYIPGWRFVPTNTNKRIMEIDREIRSLLKGIIHKRKKAINAGEKPNNDLLGILMQSNTLQDNNIHLRNDKQIMHVGLSLEEIIDECKIFYLAGQETTSTLLSWTLILLGKHQDWQSRAREEVLNTFGNNSPDFHGLNHLKIVNMIFQEVLRLYPPAAELSRTVTEDIKVGDIFLPKGVLVNLPILLIHQDEKLWGPDAKEFNPERFSKGISNATGGNVSFFSFGWGPRICIGSNFAMIEAKLALALILQRFSFELSPSYAHAPAVVGTLQPQYGAPIILHHL